MRAEEAIESIFHEAAECAPEARAALLDERCAGDPELRAAVEELLRHDLDAGSAFLAGATESRPVADAPTRVGRYRVLRPLGEGGMGVVYEAEQDHPRRRVALKLLRGSFMSRSLVARFEREAAALGRMRHPGIAQIFEAGSWPEPGGGTVPYFAMELVEGVPLDRHVRERRPTPRQVLAIVADIAEIVEYAHGQGIIHRDLKPANILVEAAADGAPRPRILDFGIARTVHGLDGDGGAASLRTDVGQLLGTLPYMSPEQVSGDSNQIDARTDVYALGVILHELLAGKPPLDVGGRPIADAARIIRDEDPSRLGSISASFRGDIETIVLTAMDKDPLRRYPSAQALADDIRRHLADTPILARPTSRAEQLRKFARRHRAFVASTALVLLATTAAAVVSTTAYLRAERERMAAERRYDIACRLTELIRADVLTRLEALGGARSVRIDLLKKVTPHYAELARERPEDPNRIRMAWLGLVQLGRDYETVGEIALARSTLAEAEVAIRDSLKVSVSPEDRLLFEEDLGWARFQQGWVEYRGGQRDLAASFYIEAAELLGKVVAVRGKACGAAEKLALAHRRLGDIRNESGHGDAARQAYLLALDLDEARLAAQPNDAVAQTNVTRTWRRLGQLARQEGRFEDAVEWLSRTVDMREQIYRDESAPWSRVHNCAVAHQDLGGVLLDGKRYEEAVRSLERASTLFHQALDREPEDSLGLQENVVTSMQLGIARRRLGHESEARAAGAAAVSGARELLARDRPSVIHRAIAAGVFVDVEPKDLRDAARALSLIDEVIRESGGNDVLMWETKAKAHLLLGQADGAAEAERQAIALLGPEEQVRRGELEGRLAAYRALVGAK